MSRALLDINVLLALLDSDHASHGPAMEWLDREVHQGWATCAITENGFVRIICQPGYPSPVSPTEAIDRLDRATGHPHHAYWTCAVSLLDPLALERSRIHGSRQVTDAYLLALAVANDGRFVTFDRGISLTAVRGATGAHLVVL